MSKLHVCLICHTEGDANAFEVGVPAMLRIREEVEQTTGKSCTLTWALGTFHATNQQPVFDEYRSLFLDLAARGDEIGLHPHGVVENRRWTVDPFVAEDARRLCAAGFARPKTFVAGVWAFYPSTLAILEKQGFQVDASVVAGPTRQRKEDDNGYVLYDYPPSEALADAYPFAVPYRLSRDSVVRRGDSTIIEVPVSTGITELAPKDGKSIVVERYNLQRERVSTSRMEVFEFFYHPYELLSSYDSRDEDPRMIGLLTQFLVEAGSNAAVRLSSVYDAAMDWVLNTESRAATSEP